MLARDCEFVRVVMISTGGDVRFEAVSPVLRFRVRMKEALQGRFIALGLLGWRSTGNGWQAKRILFPWHADDEILDEIFQRLCEEAAHSAKKAFERRAVH